MPLRGKDRLLREQRERALKLVQGLVLETHRRLALRTPVDTGRARNNWNASTGQPDESNIPEGEYPHSGDLSIQRAVALLPRIQLGDTIFMTNALPYIGPLERGHSSQAPAGMIAVTRAELLPLVTRIVREVRNRG